MCYKVYKLTMPDGRAYIGLKACLNNLWIFERNRRRIVKKQTLWYADTLDEARDKAMEFILKYKTYKPEMGFNILDMNYSRTTTAYLCEETGEIFPSMADAGRFCGRTRAAVLAALEQDESVDGYHFIPIKVEKNFKMNLEK